MMKFNPSRINLYTISRDLLTCLWAILLSIFVGFSGSMIYFQHFYTKHYTSSMTVSVNLSGYTANATSISLARTVSIAATLDDVFKSSAMMRVAENAMGAPITGSVNAAQFPDTNLIKVTVTDTSPKKAYDTLKAISENYSNVTDYSFSNVIVEVISDPNMPSKETKSVSTPSFCVALGILTGIAVAAIVVVMSYMRDTVKNVSDVENELEARLFGTVYHNEKPGKKLPENKRRLLITNPLIGYRFTESFRKIAVKLEALRRTKGARVFMITSVAENEGKTTVSCNTAIALAQSGHKVLLIDCDFKKPAIKSFFAELPHDSEYDFHKFIENGGNIAQFIKHDPETDLYIADCVKACADSADKLLSVRFSETIAALKEQFDFIIIDTPPAGIIVDAEIIASVADATLLTVRQDYIRVTDINDQIENLSNTYFAGCIFNEIKELKFETKRDEREKPRRRFGDTEVKEA